MKFRLLSAAILGLLVSCSSDDSGPAAGTDQNYFPLNAGNYWTYDVEGEGYAERDSLYVANDTMIGGNSYKKMKTQTLPLGFYSGTLDDNGVRKVNGAVLVSGNAGLSIGTAFPVEIMIQDFIVFDGNAGTNQQLATVNGTTTQEFEGYPLNITYRLTSTSGENLSTYNAPDGTTYTDVKSVTVKMNMKITTTVNFGGLNVDVPILAEQDVVTSQRFYAKNIGMVYSSTNITYELQDFSGAGFELPIPQSGNELQTETLSTYSVEP